MTLADSNDEQAEMTAGPPNGNIVVVEPMPEHRGRRPTAAPRWRVPVWLAAGAPAWTWIGIGTALLGFVLIAIAWGQVAAETEVYLQLPYIVSAGLTGLGLVVVGATVVSVAAKQRDALDRDKQIDRLVSIMEEVRSAIEARDAAAPRRPRRSGSP